MADFTPPPSSRGNKWTVSPEFGDALLAAMGEKSNAGGPLPRLPSMLQLPLPQTPETPTLPSPIKDSAERLKMKTRVAIRDHPHRFQIVPLREAFEQKRSRERQPLELASLRKSGISRTSIQSFKKPRVNENDPVPPSNDQNCPVKIDTPGRPSILSERNKNVHAIGFSSFESPASLSHVTSRSEVHHGDLLVNTKQPKERSNTELNRNTLHFKSPSLGNLRTKPNLDIDLDIAPLPRIVSCRKRTNTLSADHTRRDERATSVEPEQRSDRRNLKKKDSLKRHAIYTQSLYVPVHERPSLLLDETCSELFTESCPLQAFPFRSSIPTSRNKPDISLRVSTIGNALGFINVQVGAPESLENNLRSHSLSSIYSQDELTRPLTYCAPPSNCNLNKAAEIVADIEPLKHQPIILELLVEVEKMIKEWS
ncbi:hypothetical protein C0991_002126 [Blastosporella zonata]|nr:hypothetical protein C0991_002126 [Blastosporella zonata]